MGAKTPKKLKPLRSMNRTQLDKEAKRLKSLICGRYCDQLGGYHHGECHILHRYYLDRMSIKDIRARLAYIRRKLNNSKEQPPYLKSK